MCFPFLCYHRGATTVADELGLGQQLVHLGASCIGSVGHRGSFWQLLTEATPVASLPPEPCHSNPTQAGSMLS